MTRKTKTKRINLKVAQAKAQRQIWIRREDHQDIPTIASAIKTVHPGTDAETVPDVMRFLFETGRRVLGIQGA